MIFVTGDCHADWRRFSNNSFYEQKDMTKDDYVIVCGDFGLWHDTKEERYWLDWLNDKPFTTLFVDGNHENFDRLYSDEFEEISWHGGKVQKIREGILHLERGYVFNIGGKDIFAFGGARCHDIRDGIIDEKNYSSHAAMIQDANHLRKMGYQFRINHYSWWEQEMPSEEEMKRGIRNLEARNNNIDFVVSHCAPQSVASLCGGDVRDKLTVYFEDIADKVMFKADKKHTKWFFGHYHDNRQIFGDYYLLYEQIIQIA